MGWVSDKLPWYKFSTPAADALIFLKKNLRIIYQKNKLHTNKFYVSLNLVLNVNLNGILIFPLGFLITCRGHPINQKGLYDLCIIENIHLFIHSVIYLWLQDEK